MKMGGIFFKNLELYPPPTVRFGRVHPMNLGKEKPAEVLERPTVH